MPKLKKVVWTTIVALIILSTVLWTMSFAFAF